MHPWFYLFCPTQLLPTAMHTAIKLHGNMEVFLRLLDWALYQENIFIMTANIQGQVQSWGSLLYWLHIKL